LGLVFVESYEAPISSVERLLGLKREKS